MSFVHERVLNLDISSIILIFKKRNLKFTLFCYFDGNDNNVVIMMSCMRFIFEWKNSELKNYEACSVIKYLKNFRPKIKSMRRETHTALLWLVQSEWLYPDYLLSVRRSASVIFTRSLGKFNDLLNRFDCCSKKKIKWNKCCAFLTMPFYLTYFYL